MFFDTPQPWTCYNRASNNPSSRSGSGMSPSRRRKSIWMQTSNLSNACSTRSPPLTQSRGGIDRTTSFLRSSRACNDHGLCPGHASFCTELVHRDSESGHSPARDIVRLGMSEKGLDITKVDPLLEQFCREGMSKGM